LKSPFTTSTQVTAVDQASHLLTVKEFPLDRATHHWPSSLRRAATSLLPSPLKSAVWTSTQVPVVGQLPQVWLRKLVPVDLATRRVPLPSGRPTRSER